MRLLLLLALANLGCASLHTLEPARPVKAGAVRVAAETSYLQSAAASGEDHHVIAGVHAQVGLSDSVSLGLRTGTLRTAATLRVQLANPTPAAPLALASLTSLGGEYAGSSGQEVVVGALQQGLLVAWAGDSLFEPIGVIKLDVTGAADTGRATLTAGRGGVALSPLACLGVAIRPVDWLTIVPELSAGTVGGYLGTGGPAFFPGGLVWEAALGVTFGGDGGFALFGGSADVAAPTPSTTEPAPTPPTESTTTTEPAPPPTTTTTEPAPEPTPTEPAPTPEPTPPSTPESP